MSDKPFAPSSERNRQPILNALAPFFADRRQVLEIGSGTGQHAAFFAAAMPQLRWQASEREAAQLAGIAQWLGEAGLADAPAPITLDVDAAWPRGPFDAVFSANTLHIMGWPQVQRLFAMLPEVTGADAKLAIYGPFNRQGRFTSDSNAAFEQWLKARDARSGIRDAAAVDALAAAAGFVLIEDIAMPSHNALRLWQRRRGA